MLADKQQELAVQKCQNTLHCTLYTVKCSA